MATGIQSIPIKLTGTPAETGLRLLRLHIFGFLLQEEQPIPLAIEGYPTIPEQAIPLEIKGYREVEYQAFPLQIKSLAPERSDTPLGRFLAYVENMLGKITRIAYGGPLLIDVRIPAGSPIFQIYFYGKSDYIGQPLTISWGDGSIQQADTFSSSYTITHTYAAPGDYTISMLGETYGFRFSGNSNYQKTNVNKIIALSGGAALRATNISYFISNAVNIESINIDENIFYVSKAFRAFEYIQKSIAFPDLRFIRGGEDADSAADLAYLFLWPPLRPRLPQTIGTIQFDQSLYIGRADVFYYFFEPGPGFPAPPFFGGSVSGGDWRWYQRAVVGSAVGGAEQLVSIGNIIAPKARNAGALCINCESLVDFGGLFMASGEADRGCFIDAWKDCFNLSAGSVVNIVRSIDECGILPGPLFTADELPNPELLDGLDEANFSVARIDIDWSGSGVPGGAGGYISSLKAKGWRPVINGDEV